MKILIYDPEDLLRKGYMGFSKLSASIRKRSGYSKERADAAAAAIGRRKYGKKKFQRAASSGKKMRGEPIQKANRSYGHGEMLDRLEHLATNPHEYSAYHGIPKHRLVSHANTLRRRLHRATGFDFGDPLERAKETERKFHEEKNTPSTLDNPNTRATMRTLGRAITSWRS